MPLLPIVAAVLDRVFPAVKTILFAMWRWISSQGRGAAAADAVRAGGQRKVWRITDDHPQGIWIDPDEPPPPPSTQADDTTTPAPLDSWTTSSMDLRDGMQVVEHDSPRKPH